MRPAPASAVAAGIALAALLVVGQFDGAYRLGVWGPLAVGVLLLLALATTLQGQELHGVPRPVAIAAAALGGYTAWSYLSIAWAADRAEAWDGANRTLLYLACFLLFGLWRRRERTAAALLTLWAAGMAALAAYAAVRLLGDATPADWFRDDRLIQPAGYANAAACQWLMAVWPCLALAGRREVPLGLRALLSGAVVVLVELAVLSLSRGALLAAPVVLALFVALVPGRLRHLALLVPIGAGIALSLPAVLDVGPVARADGDLPAALDPALRGMLAAALAVALTVLVALLAARHAAVGAELAARIRRGWAVLATAGIAAGVLAGLIAAGNPAARVDRAWSSFQGGYTQRAADTSRFANGLGSNRHDFYRAALDTFADHPLVGAGADSFQIEYLARARSTESPRYPHSWPLRTLSQTGLVGAGLLLAALAAAALAVWRALRRPEPLAAAVAGGAAFGFLYWLAHGAGDWFWEYAGLGAPAFALLGLACALTPGGSAPREGRGRPRAAVALLLAGVVLVLGASLTLPWLADRTTRAAASTWPRDPARAYRQLDRAAAENPLSARPYVTAGTIALRQGDLARAERMFAAARRRTPRGAYAVLELGALASQRGDRRRALSLLEEAVRLDRQDPIARAALAAARQGRVDVSALNATIVRRARHIAGRPGY